ncbi:MAG TPA: HPP family protein [Tissierellia bacterium]|jgi:CBS-domain-containing membrane protein|nr:HPP family protein [Tissierellia bacterium]
MSEPKNAEKTITYFEKWKGKTFKADLPKVGFDQALWSFIGGFCALFIVSYLAQSVNVPSPFAPFGASSVLLFGAPAAPFSQPRNVVGGHILAAIVGVTINNLLGTSYFAIAVGVGLAIALMVKFNLIHPPAGATAFVGVTGSAGNYMWVLNPVAIGSIILIIVALVVNNLDKKRSYPSYWI